jgi:hypothetical protein
VTCCVGAGYKRGKIGYGKTSKKILLWSKKERMDLNLTADIGDGAPQRTDGREIKDSLS